MSHEIRLTDANDRNKVIGYIDRDDGTIRDVNGKVEWCQLTDSEDFETNKMLADHVCETWNKPIAAKFAGSQHGIRYRDSSGRDRIIKMDLAPTDVHVPGNLPGYAAGYHLEEGVADEVCPVIMIPKEEDKFWTWNSSASFNRAIPNVGAPNGNVTEVQPSGGFTSFATVAYALGAFVPTEVQANADAPIDVNQKVMQRVIEALKLEREIRVANLLTNSANYASANVRTLASTFNWNGGSASAPITDMYAIMHASALQVSAFVMSRLVYDAWATNANVQKFIAYKNTVQAIPNADQVQTVLRLPKIIVAEMKYNNASGVLDYVWPSDASASDCVAVRLPKQMPPSDQRDVATAMTARWAGGLQKGTPENGYGTAEAVSGGFMVRRYFRQSRGPRGGQMVVACHNDAEVSTSTLVGGLIVNPIQ